MTIKNETRKSDKIVNLNNFRSRYKNTKEIANLDKNVLRELERQIKKIIDG